MKNAIARGELNANPRRYNERFWPAILFVTLLFHISTAQGQFAIKWSTIDGGGGTSTGGVYSVSGTIGQPDAGKMSGGNFSLEGDFWSVVAIQTPGAPILSLSRSNNAVIVSWPLSAIGFNLERSATLSALSNSWTTISPPYSTNATSFYVPIPSLTGQTYFRLHKP
jgi:hypothetical protein